MSDYQHLLNPRIAKVTDSAGFFRRGLSFIFDILVIDLVITAPFTPLFLDLVARAQEGDFFNLAYTTREAAAAISLFLVIYLYFVLFEYLLKQTPGMMLFGTKVQGTERLWQYLARNIFILPVFPIIVLWVVEPLLILLRKQSFLEQLTGTRTIHERKVMF